MSGISSLSQVEISLGNTEHVEACLRIAEGLQEHFNETGLRQMRNNLSRDSLYVATENGRLVGFATVDGEEGEPEITWLAVDPAWQGNGIGRAIVKRIAENLVAEGAEVLQVKTLAEKAEYPPFEATRRFYEKNGFVRVETVDPYPGWNGDPAAIYEKELSVGETK